MHTWRKTASRCLKCFCAPLLAGLLPAGCPPQYVAPPGPGVALNVVARGLTAPVGLVEPPDASGRLFIVDQVGLVRIVGADGTLRAAPFLDIRDRMVALNPTYDERGLLGLAFHPQYTSNGRFFIFYNAPPGPGTPAGFDGDARVAEFRVDPADADRALLATEQVLLSIPKPQYNHNGGQLAFGPDGFLYISVGDGGGANDRGLGHNAEIGNAQDRTNLLGKVLRIDVAGAGPYAVPADNPFAGDDAARPEIWAYGLRNPWRFSFDVGGDRRLFLADAGQDLIEEVDMIVRGGNYGWRIREGTFCFDPQNAGDPPAECPATGADGAALIDPILEFPHTDAAGRPTTTVVIGGYVYRGTALPEMVGQYIFGHFTTTGTFSDGRLLAGAEDSAGGWLARELTVAGREGGRLQRFILAFGQDAAGEVYVLTSANFGPVGDSGEVYRLAPAQ